MQDPFVGQIAIYPYTFAPLGWIECAGQLLPISQNAALFSLLGTNFGGDGRTTFGLPDLQGRVPAGQGTLPGGATYDMGETAGSESVVLTSGTMAQHNHSLAATTAQGTTNTPANAILAAPFVGGGRGGGGSTGDIYNPGTPDTTLVAAALAPAGNGVPHNNVQPVLVLRPCIALTGVFPQRS